MKKESLYALNLIDSYIKNNFLVSLLSDSKWFKLMNELVDEFEEVYIEFKLINESQIRSTIFDYVDEKPFFIEPIFYKEIEWLDFPNHYNTQVNKRKSRSYQKKESQDIEKIETAINSTGKFFLEKSDDKLRLVAYRR